MGKGKVWTDDELLSLENYYRHAFVNEYSVLFPGRSISAVSQTAARIGLQQATKKVYFPRTYDSDVDGGYVSGLVDGEGSFMVSFVERRGRWNFNPKFGITLRIDDGAILKWVKSYFDCGRYSETVVAGSVQSPRASLVVADLYSLMSKVLPHFDTYPLRAKKRHDYAIWKEMVLLQADNFRRKWSKAVRLKMAELHNKLKAGRLLDSLGDTDDQEEDDGGAGD